MRGSHTYLDIAKMDLQAAKVMLEAGMYNHCVWLCHRYVEKCFKEAIEKHGTLESDVLFLQTHRIHRLAARCGEILGFHFTLTETIFFRGLTDYYFDTSYPSKNFRLVPAEEAAEVMEQTLKFQAAYEEVLCKTF